MPQKKSVLLLIPLFALAVTVFIYGQRYYVTPQWGPLAPSDLTIPAEALDIGEVWATSSFRAEIPLVNVTERTIVVNSFITSCNCTDISPQQLSIPPGGREVISLDINLLSLKSGTVGAQSPFAVDLIPSVVPPGTSGKWTIRGQVKTPIVAAPTIVDFGDVFIGTPVHRDIHFICAKEVYDLSSSFEGEGLRVHHSGPHGQEGRMRIIADTAFLDPKSTPHRADGTLSLRFRLTNEARTLTLPIPVSAVFHRDIHILDPSVHLGAFDIGQQLRENIVIRSRTGRQFRILKVEPPIAATLEYDSQAAEPHISVQLKLNASTVGSHQVVSKRP